MRQYIAYTLCVISVLLTNYPLHSRENNADLCYKPTESNVSYKQVETLVSEKPDKIVPYGEDALQFGELWLPRKDFSIGQAPLVILIHGGCWLNAFDIKHTHALSTALAKSGYAVWSIEYRRTGDAGGGWPGSFNDIKQAIQLVIDADFNEMGADVIDTSNVAIIGHSAGGHLALLAGGHYREQPAIKVVVGLAAITDISAYSLGSNSCEMATSRFMGGALSERPEEYKRANPRQQKLHANTRLVQGGQDVIVSPEQASLLINATVTELPSAGHFDMIHPNTASFQALLKELASSL